MDLNGPWSTIPFRFQVMEAMKMPPLCFPHFPRLDWTHWFVPLGGSDGDLRGWLGQLIAGLGSGETSILNLLDRSAWDKLFPDGPPKFLRLSPMTFSATLPTVENGNTWWSIRAADIAVEPAWDGLSLDSPLARPKIFEPQWLNLPEASDSLTWPGTPVIRQMADSGQDAFVWACFAVTLLLAASRSSQSAEKQDMEEIHNERLKSDCSTVDVDADQLEEQS
eukprot:TRINITY_DN94128_c0_g1_i1.p1 TRINITY_DN94128_c0_g1~~TRINITY_DN94128_c0_g1_i1.p1  ORF type:complete len:242 (-),score=47.48 TRINITY_DN94128_c0_g1_i1:369-1034(-)